MFSSAISHVVVGRALLLGLEDLEESESAVGARLLYMLTM